MVTSKKYLSQRGLTLLEVMVAVAIASIVLVVLISLVLTSLDMEENARRVTEATMIADERLKEIERTDLPEPGQIEGLVDEMDPSGYSFRRIVSETMIENVYLIQMDIFWNKKKNSVSLSSYVLKKDSSSSRPAGT